MTLSNSGLDNRSHNTSNFNFPLLTLTMSWSIFSAVFCCFTENITGVCTKDRKTSLVLSSTVAEKNNDCRGFGNKDTRYLTSFIKPMSTIRSTSSRTTFWKCPRFSSRWPMRSLSLPGVPTTKLGRFLSSYICRLIFIPPTVVTMLRPVPFAKILNSSPIWVASSLVGTTISTFWFLSFCTLSINEIKKAPVLPVPVLAIPITSFPASISGIAFSWIGVGVV